LWLFFFGLMFHVMWNEVWINGLVNENERVSLSKLNDNWNVFKWEKIEQVIGLSLSFALFRYILWETKYNWSFIVFVSSHVDQRAQHVSHNASILMSTVPLSVGVFIQLLNLTLLDHTHQIFFLFLFFLKCCLFLIFLNLI
jgi:hypothetical protein